MHEPGIPREDSDTGEPARQPYLPRVRIASLYKDLRALAQSILGQGTSRGEDGTSLVNQAVLRLQTRNGADAFESDGHLLAVAATAMRQILVDRARSARTRKRSATGDRLHLESLPGARGPSAVDVIDLDAALADLGAANERCARVVELRFFLGLTVEETAAVLGVGTTTAEADWRFARAWLTKRLHAYEPRPER